MTPEAYFPRHYREARAAFLGACAAARIETVARVHPSASGPDGRLFLDTAAVGPREAETALLLISGTHGVEGYFGSGMQTGLLREGLAPPRGARLVLVHALNPFGFAWNRRVNEDNVDINRNFIDHALPPANPEYAALADAIAPGDISPECLSAADAKLAAYAKAHGAFALQAAVSRGQYQFPGGLCYGGARESWSAQSLRAVLREDLARVRKLVVIDFHTGLGLPGTHELITDAPPDSPAYARARALWGERVRSTEAGESVSARLTGTVEQGLGHWLGDSELTFAALEVATHPLAIVFDALRKDNWLHHHAGPGHPLAPQIERACRDAFYPDTREWKRAAWNLGCETVGKALAAL